MGQPPLLGRPAITIGFLLCICFAFFATASANKCVTGCHGMHTSKSYKEGHIYVYDLEGTSITSVSEAQGEASLKLKATVELSVQPECVHQLRIKGASINGAPIPLSDVEKYGLQFNYHDGHIDTEVCADSSDSQASLNIKRAIISLFQSAVFQESGSTTHHETDIFGSCPTDFTFHKDGDSLIVQKYRNLGQCSHRENIQQGLISANFDASSGIKTSPILNSEQKIEQRFKHGVLNKAASIETYRFKPFSNGENGAITIVETVLTLKGEKGGSSATSVSQPKTLIFDSPHPVAKSSVEALTNALKAAKNEVAGGVKPFAARRFAELIKVLRVSTKNDILSVYHKIRTGGNSDKIHDKKLFLDALFRVGSGESVEVAVELIKSREITGIPALLFYASLSLVRHINLPAVTATTSLLQQPDLPRIAYLGIGQVIGKYCQEHTCENVAEVKNAIHKIREKVGNGKSKTREQENSIISALKALGNARFLDDVTLQKLANIAADKNVRNRVRVAAIEALPTRCSMKWKNVLFKVLADREEDSEIRIKAYLSLVSCACPHVANNLKEILDKETVNQVGSFITSHLRNLRASTDPNKQEAKRQLGLIKSRTKFPEDFRKFSFNQELSYNIDAFGAGSSIENNVIYSQNSFIPRSVSLNLTTEIFGRSFNVLELDTRVENLDRILEHYFGPKGVVTQYDLEDLPDDTVEYAHNAVKYIKDQLQKVKRERREVKQGELDRFAKGVHLRSNEVDQDVDLDLSIKLFGVELAYLSYQGNPQKLSSKQIIEQIKNSIHKSLEVPQNFDYDAENHLHFLDAELVYPTGLGIPLSLGVTGTSVIHLKANGKIDIPALIKDIKNSAIRIAVESSASVRIAGNMIVEGFGVESGMKIISTLHTATGSDVSVMMLDKGIDINFGLPKKKQELISVSTEVLLSSGAKGDEYVSPKFNKGKEYSDCFDQLSGLLGVTVCGNVLFPYDGIESVQRKPFFPLSGPSKFAISLENNDVSSYHFKVYYDDKHPDTRSLEILLETPNSKTPRRIALLLEGSIKDDKFFKVSFDSPIKKASIEALLKNQPQEHSLTITVHNDQMEYFARVGLLANGNKYKPILEYKVPEHIEKLAGTKSGIKSVQRGGQQYNLQGVVDVTDEDGGKKYTFDKVVLVASGRKLISLDGFVSSLPNEIIADMIVGYVQETLTVKFDAKRLAQRSYALSLSALPSKDPTNGFNINWEYERGEEELNHKFIFVSRPDLNDEFNRFELVQRAVYKLNTKDFALSMSNKITCPLLGNLLLKLKGGITRNSIDSDIAVKYYDFKLGTELSAKIDSNKPGDYEIEFEAEILENTIKLKSKRVVIEVNRKSKFTNLLEISPGGKYEADAVVTYDINKNNINVQIDGDINLNGKKVKVATGLEANQQAVNSRAFFTIDGTEYIDFVLKLRYVPSPNGHLHLVLKNYLTANGQFSYNEGKGTGHLTVDVPRMNRKIKISGDLGVTGTKHVGHLEIFYDADNDLNKYFKVSTISIITKNSIDTSNVIEILTYKIELNGKGTLHGTLNEGELAIDADITLPNGRYFVYKGKRVSHKKDGKYDVHVQSELVDHVNKNGPSRKISYIGDGSDIDPKTSTFQIKSQTKFTDFDDKDIQFVVSLKNLLLEDVAKRSNEIGLDISGSKIARPFNFEISTDYNANDVTGKIKSSFGNDLVLKGSGSFIGGNKEDTPCKFDGTVHLRLPNEHLHDIKFDTSTNVLLPYQENKPFEVSSSNAITYNGDKTLKVNAHAKHLGIDDEKYSEGTGSVTLTILNAPPLTVQGSYKQDPTGDVKKASGTLNVNYGDKESSVSVDGAYLPDLSSVNFNAKASTPFEKLHNINLQFNHKSDIDTGNRKTDFVLKADNAQYTLNSEIQNNNIAPMIHILFTCPSGKTEILSKFQKLGDNDYAGEWKIDTSKGFVVADARVNLESIDNFIININFDSDKIKQRKIHAEIANKPTAKTGKRIIITVTTDGKNIVTGSTNYKKRDEEGKVIVEGTGSLKIGENTRSSSFKYTRQKLTREIDGEIGVAMVLNANFGPSAIVGELKFSNKEVHIFNSYCEQSKDCAHFKLQSIFETDKKSYLKHQITVEVDLKKFNVPAEFGLKTNTEYRDFLFDHGASLYLHSSKDKSEYSSQIYVHPKETAVILTLPTRELAIIGSFDLPKTKQTGAYKLDLSGYLDRKNKPSDKISLTANGDVNLEKNSLSLNGDVKFTYPTQPKDMAIKGRLHYGGEHLFDANVDIDVFAKKSQKINVVAKLERVQIPKGYKISNIIEVTSRGQQLKVESKSHFAISPNELGYGSILSYTDQHQKPKSVGILFSANFNEIHLLITSPNKEIIKSDTKMELASNLVKIDNEVALLGDEPVITTFEAHDFRTFKYLCHVKNNPNTKLAADGRIVLGQLAEVHADFYKEGNKKDLFHVLIHLDEGKFLKPDFGYNKDNVIAFVEFYQARITKILQQAKNVNIDIVNELKTELKDLVEHLKKAQPNIKPLLEYYKTELTKMKEELHTDQTIEEIQATLNKYFGGIITSATEVVKQIIERLEELNKQFNVVIAKITNAVEATYPQIMQSLKKILQVTINILEEVSKLGRIYLEAVLKTINEHQKELKELAVMISELTQDVAKVLFKAFNQYQKNVEEFIRLLKDHIKAAPIYETLKEQYQNIIDFNVPEAVLSPIEELCGTIKNILPTEELRELFEATYEYVMKHVKHQKVDDATEIKKIYSRAIIAFQSIITLLESHTNFGDFINFFETRIPFDIAVLMKLPGISTLKISIINLLRNRELPSPLDIYYSYRPTLHPGDIIPPFSKTGTVVDGGHFFTFDGRHFTMPGSCSYILAQDMQDGNFSVVANFNNGNLISVTLTEPKESITIKANGNILVNNKPSDYPAYTKNLNAYLVLPFANIRSTYGVHVMCSKEAPMICTVRVSGFYLGKLRGLFGDANNEPYDDYTLPSGKITESETDFGNAYKLKTECATANAIDHKNLQRAPVCTDYFANQASTLSNCFKYVNPANYRDACDYAVNAGPQGPCLISAVYYAACHEQRVYGISIPAACANCKVGGNTVPIGDTFSVKVPKKEADIIFVVEQDVKNEKIFKDLLAPLMADLRDELKHHGVTDVHIGLIGFGEHMKWPQHYTTNGNTNIEGDVKNMKFEATEPEEDDSHSPEEKIDKISTAGSLEKKLTYLRQGLDVELGTFELTDAYEEAIRYPFRPNAAKAVVGVIATPCEKSPFPISLQQLRILLGQKIYRDLGLTYYHVYFPHDIMVADKPQKNIVGYDQDSAYTFVDSKKRPLGGNSELKNNMVITNDVCADFAITSGGAAFSSNNFLEAKPNQRKQFAQVAARRIIEGLTAVEFEQDCTCELYRGVVGRSRCKIVNRKEKEQLVKPTKGGVKG